MQRRSHTKLGIRYLNQSWPGQDFLVIFPISGRRFADIASCHRGDLGVGVWASSRRGPSRSLAEHTEEGFFCFLSALGALGGELIITGLQLENSGKCGNIVDLRGA